MTSYLINQIYKERKQLILLELELKVDFVFSRGI